MSKVSADSFEKYISLGAHRDEEGMEFGSDLYYKYFGKPHYETFEPGHVSGAPPVLDYDIVKNPKTLYDKMVSSGGSYKSGRVKIFGWEHKGIFKYHVRTESIYLIGGDNIPRHGWHGYQPGTNFYRDGNKVYEIVLGPKHALIGVGYRASGGTDFYNLMPQDMVDRVMGMMA